MVYEDYAGLYGNKYRDAETALHTPALKNPGALTL